MDKNLSDLVQGIEYAPDMESDAPDQKRLKGINVKFKRAYTAFLYEH